METEQVDNYRTSQNVTLFQIIHRNKETAWLIKDSTLVNIKNKNCRAAEIKNWSQSLEKILSLLNSRN